MLLYPLAVAVLLSYLLHPLGAWLERKGLPRIAANLMVILLTIVIVGGVTYVLYTQASKLTQDLPQLKDQATSNVRSMTSWISSKAGMSNEEFNEWIEQQISGSFETGGKYISTIFSATTGTIASIGIMPVYVFMLLYYRDKFRDFFFMIFSKEKYPQSAEVIEKISYVTGRYMRGVVTVVLILCVVNSAGLFLIGLQYALLLGILSAICNFIPYFGTLLGAVFPLAMAFFTSDSPSTVIQVAILFIIVQFTENNILTPNITGGSVQINPFVTILSLIAGGLVWGIPGMLVIVPFLGMIKIIFEHHNETKPVAFLIGTGGTEKHAITSDKIKELFRIRKKK